MGIKDVKTAFEAALGQTYTCELALMDTVRGHDVESQVLFFRGNDPDGAQYEIRSDPLRAGADLILSAKDVAQRLLAQRKPS